ncbi:MAG: hypothetical protein KIH01_07305 [Candidatus Freyarchaeota archaeon]|nr:hypothetical protein [Candidatus Jordarchaeia archaeon]
MLRVHHALGFHFHQPPGNIDLLVSANPAEAIKILRCYTRPLQFLSSGGVPVNVSVSGSLMEQMLSVSVNGLGEELHVALNGHASLSNVEVLATGFYHPIFPLIPEDDWKPHIVRWIMLAKQVGFRLNVFWPPELGFTMKMTPVLSELGFKYVVVDGRYVERCGEDGVYRPHIAEYSGAIPRGEYFSRILAGGVDAASFVKALKSEASSFRGLLATTWFNGKNGNWLRSTPSGNLWGSFFKPYASLLEREYCAALTSFSSFLLEHPPEDYVKVRMGAWRTFSNDGESFKQWVGLEEQKRALAGVWGTSLRLRRIKALSGGGEDGAADVQAAEEHLLKAQTSCNFFWEAKWLHRVCEELSLVDAHISRAAEKAHPGENVMEGLNIVLY